MTISSTGAFRAPDLWFSQNALGNITRTQLGIHQLSNQLSTGRAISRFSDDPVKAALISTVDRRMAISTQVQRNFSSAKSSLGILDNALGEANDLSREAKDIASAQINLGSSATERAGQATVVSQMIASLLNLSHRQGEGGYLFGGSKTSSLPIEEILGGFRYTGTDTGIVTDLGQAASVPVTIAGPHALGATSGRIRGDVDLNPDLTLATSLSSLSGARSLGITAGSIEISINSGTRRQIDLVGADTIEDVIKRINAAIVAEQTDTGVTVMGPGGIAVSGGSLSLDVTGTNTVQFFDLTGNFTAQDLGLTAATPFSFSASTSTGVNVQPRLTMQSSISSLAGLTQPPSLGQFRVNNMGRTAIVDLSSASTIEDIKNAIESTNLGLRVQINQAGTGIDVLNEIAGSRAYGLSIEETSATNQTATALGIRSLSATTRLSDFNDGRGVSIVTGQTDPISGNVSPQLNIDFEIHLGDSAGTALTIDLRPQDILNVQAVIDRINSEATTQLTALGLPTNSLVAALSPTTNALTLTQSSTFTNRLTVNARNNSGAAEQLGFITGTWDQASSTLSTEDRAKVRVDNLFTHLIDLRDSLLANDTVGIALAGEKLGTSTDRVAETRGLVGSFAQRVESAETFEQDRGTLDQKLRSDLADVDYASAASRFSLLQTQLEAAMRVTSSARQLSLMDFLG